MTTTTKTKTETKDEQDQKRKAYIKASNKSEGLRRRLIALCWAHAETRKQFSQGDDEWTPQDQLICNLLNELESSIDELIQDTSSHLLVTQRKFKELCTCDD
tara:strand:- start:127 stop:432 length:306 start_codon:yes stop_codon:yes gene_type:complete